MYKLYEGVGLVGTIDPASYTTGTQNSDEVDMSKWTDLMVIVSAGNIPSSGALNGTVLSGAVTGTTTTTVKTMTAYGDTDDNKQTIFYIRGDELTAGHRYVMFQASVTGTALLSAVLLGVGPRYAPATDYDLASVAQIATP